MQWNEVREKTKKVIGKLGKKSIITICTVLVLGCAVVLNVILYQNGQTEKQSNKLAIDLSEAGETTDTQTEGTIGAYFQSMSLNRKQARDEAMEVLQAVADSQTALDEAKEAGMERYDKACDGHGEGDQYRSDDLVQGLQSVYCRDQQRYLQCDRGE